MRLGGWALLLGLAGCRAIVGSFEECATDADCDARGAGLACVNRLCVKLDVPPLDPRCQVLTPGLEGELLRVASIMPRTRADGSVNATGVAREEALLLAAEQLNPPQRQGVRGRSIELVGCDSQGSAEVATALAQHLVSRGTVALFSSGSAETIAAARVTVPASVLLVSVSASAPEITDYPDQPPGAPAGAPGLLWRTSTTDRVQAKVVAEQLVDAGTPRTAVLLVNDAYGQGLGQAFSALYPSASHDTFPYARNGDLTSALDDAAAWAPARLLVVAFPEDAVRLVNELQGRPALAGRPLFFTDSAKSPSLLTGAAALVEGARGSAPAPAPLPSQARSYFVTQFTQRFGTDPLSVSATSNAFDAMMCVALAAWSARDQLDGPSIAAGMTRLYSPGALSVPLTPTSFNTATRELDTGRPLDVVGASGALDFDPVTGEAVGPIEIWAVSQGAFVQQTVVAP